MWVCITLTCLLSLMASKVDSNESVNSNQERASSLATISVMPIQFISNSSLNSSLMENQLQEQISLSNTSLLDLQNDNNTQQLQTRFRERKRQERLLLIQSQILQRLGISGRAINTSVNAFSDEERSLLNRVVQSAPTPRTRAVTGVNQISSSEIFAERLQSFYPSCSVPNHTDPTLWNLNSDSQMKLYYDISFPRSSQSRTQVNAVSAKLRVFKFHDPPPQPTPINNILSDRINRIISEQGLTISLYQYMRPLRQNRREKKRLVDSRTVPFNFRGYIEFNVINAINYWQNNPIRNFGLYVDIEDPYGTHLTPTLYLNQMNCSVQDTPMPNLADIYPEVNNETSLFYNENYPTLDLMTVEVVEDEQISSENAMNASLGGARRKRETNRKKEKCSMEKSLISMTDLNLDHVIIYPTSFQTVTCSGHCHKHRTNRYACKPSDHRDMEFVFLDEDGNPRIKKLKKFVPQSCQCVKTNSY